MKRKISELIGLFVIVFGAIFFVSFLSIIAINESRNTGGNSYHIDFEFIDIEGNLINSTNHTGKVIVLYFFTLSCPPCKISSPLLASIEDDYLSSQLLIITITMNPADSNSNLYIWKTNLNASWIIVRDDLSQTYSSQLDVAYTPTAIIIDQNSNFVNKIVGSDNFDTKVRSKIELLI